MNALDHEARAYAESRILRQDQDGFTIAVPLTEFAAKWWGRGTRWCTAAEKDNKFRQYHKDAPLIVVVIPELKEKGKFQIWTTEGDVQFMNAADQRPPEDLVAQYWPRFEPVICSVLRQNSSALARVPEYLRTEDMCRIAVAQNGWALSLVPEKLRSDDMCRISVAQHGEALEYVPRKLRTKEMCKIAVFQNGAALRYVPEHLRTAAFCRIALEQNGEALSYVPKALHTEEMHRIAVGQAGLALVAVPDVFLTGRRIWKLFGMQQRLCAQRKYAEEICRIAVMQNGKILEYIPQDLRTEEICRIAVAQNGEALKHVPEALRTQDLCRIAVARDGWYLWAVPETLRTEDLCGIAVAENGRALSHVPQKLRTEALCRIAVLQNWEAWRDVPDDLRAPMRDLLSPPIPTWDLSLLDEITSALDCPTSPDLLQTVHA